MSRTRLKGEQAYLDLLDEVMTEGSDRGDRTGTGTRSLFGRQIRFDLNDGFPLLTTKKVFLRGIIEELLWFLRGSTNAKELEDKNVNIWASWGDPETRELGPVYGWQWRSFGKPTDQHWDANNPRYKDQIAALVHDLKTNPNSRRHLVVAWNPNQVDEMALPPCHCLFQFYVVDGKLSCQLYQRSADIFLGVPFNIASYALLTQMLAQQCGYGLGEFVHTFGDVHLYHNHFEQATEQLSRSIVEKKPQMTIAQASDIYSYRVEDFVLTDYEPHPTIKAPVAV